MPIKEAKGKAAPSVTKTPINGEGGGLKANIYSCGQDCGPC